MKKYSFNILFFIFLVIASVFSRLETLEANFAFLGGASFLAGYFIRYKKVGIFIPLVLALITDIFIELFTNTKGFYGLGQLSVYAAYLIMGAIGFYSNINTKNFLFKWTLGMLGIIFASISFFVITNFFCWLTMDMYKPLSFFSAQNCFNLSLPFFRSSLKSDLVFTTPILFILLVVKYAINNSFSKQIV